MVKKKVTVKYGSDQPAIQSEPQEEAVPTSQVPEVNDEGFNVA